MGQYYKAIILGPSGQKEFIRVWISPFTYGNGSKLTEHSWMDNPFVAAVENLLSPDGIFYMSRLVWAGDYADEESDSKQNLYNMALEADDVSSSDHVLEQWASCRPQQVPNRSTARFPYIVNHDKKLYVEKKGQMHPLPLLTVEGNGRGGGDYRGSNETLCGSWARDTISLEKMPPAGYEELDVTFEES